MNVEEAKARLGQSFFLDVREPYEWESGHIEGSVHIPIGQVKERAGELPEDEEIVVVCQVGQRSELVANWLKTQGRTAHNLDGGLLNWASHGLPLVSDANPQGQVIDGWARDLSGNRVNPDEG